MVKLTHDSISSYVSDVIPLKLLSDNGVRCEGVKWKVSGDAVCIREFINDPEIPFSDGVMVSLKSVGEATVIAEYMGASYECKAKVRERAHYSSEDKHNYYRGDMHTHTTRLHNHEEFLARTDGFQTDMINFIKEENLLDFGVISDHSIVMGYGYEFMQAFLLEEKSRPMEPILFPGSESGNTIMQKNRFGLDTNYGGELVVINADNHVNAFDWKEFTDAFNTSVDPILIFAHPQADTFKHGNWNFRFERITKIPELHRMAKGIEMGNGVAVKANILHEYSFVRALDAGFKVTTTCGSDGHGIRGYKICPGKTIIMAPEKTREAFVDALLNLRAYASESANVKIRYTVNGMTAPCQLPLTNNYSFHVEFDYFEEDESTKVVKCQLVSDGGEWLREFDNITNNTIDFEIKSDTARYFFLRFQDREGRRTWSCPVFCSRPYDEYALPNVTPLDQSVFDAFDETAERDAGQVLFGDHIHPYETENKKTSIIIDMKDERDISALGYATPRMPRTAANAHGECVINHVRYPRRIRISTSVDGVNYSEVFSGGIKTYSDEEIFEFKQHKARYVKFEVLKTVADEYGRKEYMNCGLLIGTLALFDT